MILKVVYLIETPFNKRDFERFGIQILIDEGFEVEVWELSHIVYPDWHKNVAVPDLIDFKRHRLFLSKKDVITAVSALTGECFVICLTSYNLTLCFLYRILSKREIKYAIFISNSLHIVQKWTFGYLIKRLRATNFSHLINRVFCFIPIKWLGIKSAALMLRGGEKSKKGSYLTDEKTEALLLHALDYDVYLKEKKICSNISEAFGVFLDEDVPFHQDYYLIGRQPYATAEEYYPLMCKFFDLIERKCGKKIIIAAHPRSHYEKREDVYGGRAVLRGQTARLVKESAFVITHYSTSLNFAVLFEKPLIFVTTDQINNCTMGSLVETIADYFGKKPINLNNISNVNLEIENELIMNCEKYVQYKREYIKNNGTPDIPFWQVVANTIRSW